MAKLDLGLSDLESAHGLPSGILGAIMHRESRGNPNAVSPAGAQGLFQFMPDTAKQYGIDPFNPQQSAQAAAKMVGELYKKYGGDIGKVAAGYNWGQGNVDRLGIEKAPKETRDYMAYLQSAIGTNAATNKLPSVDDLFPAKQSGAVAPTVKPQSLPSVNDLFPGRPEKPSFLASMGRGMLDVGQGLKQLDMQAINFIRDNPQIAAMPVFAPMVAAAKLRGAQDVQGYTKGVQGDIEGYEAQRAAAYGGKNIPIDWGRVAGGAAATAPLALINPGAALAGRVGVGAATGAAAGGANFVPEGGSRLENATFGALLGGALPAVTTGIGKAINPIVPENVKELIAQGITLTPGQILGGGARKVEESLSSVPLLGSFISNAQRQQFEKMNEVAINRALSPIGEKLPKGVMGRDAIELTGDKLSAAYTNTLNKIGALPIDNALISDLQSLGGMISNLPKEKADQFLKIVNNEISARFNPQGYMTSEGMKGAESNLWQIAKGYQKSADYDTRVLGNAILEAKNTLNNWVTRNAPKDAAAELAQVNKGYSNFKVVQKAASMLGSEEGIATPAQLQNAVKTMDKTKDKRAFAEGRALMQDLSEPAKSVLSSKLPDSGTAGRAATMAMLYAPLAGGTINPSIALGALPAAAYTQSGMKALQALLTQRPAIAANLSEMINKVPRYITPALAQQKGNK